MQTIYKKSLVTFYLSFHIINLFCQATPNTKIPFNDKTGQKSFRQWHEACAQLPAYNQEFKHTALTEKEFSTIISNYSNSVLKDPKLTESLYWLDEVPDLHRFHSSKCMPYAQKLVVNPGSKIAFHGDLHGDIHALNNFIAYLQENGYVQDFKVVQNDFYLIFLGDYTDRGYYGAEVWYTIMRLKIANPDCVYMIRGNHEDEIINDNYGFTAELKSKFGKQTTCARDLYKLYNFLPVVLYLGSGSSNEINYLQCCHGGLELGFHPGPLLSDERPVLSTSILKHNGILDRNVILNQLSSINRQAIEQYIPKQLLNPFHIKSAYDIGFMWNDFIINTHECILFGSRGWECGKSLTHDLLKTLSTKHHKLRGVFRAHQHGDPQMMQRILNRDNKGHPADIGVGKLWTDHIKIKQPGALWDGIVCTFLVTPTAFGKLKHAPFDFDAFGLLKTAEEYENWELAVLRLKESPTESSLL